MAEGVVDVDEANISFKDIGGLDEELEEVKVLTSPVMIIILKNF